MASSFINLDDGDKSSDDHNNSSGDIENGKNHDELDDRLSMDSSKASLLPEVIQKKKDRYEARKLSYENVQHLHWWKDLLWRNKGSIIYLVLAGIVMMIFGLTIDGWNDFGWQAWWSIAVTLFTFLLLVRNDWDPSLSMMFSMTLLLAPNVITPKEALEGFSNQGVFTIAILFVTARAVSDCGILNLLIKYLIPPTKSLLWAMVWLLVPNALLSAFVANTPQVAMMIPLFENFARQRGFPISKLLIPLSYANILGGTLTMIGTSTNLIVSGLGIAREPDLEFPFFLVAVVGAPIMVAGLIYIIGVGQFDIMLPIRTPAYASILNHPRQYLISLRVASDSTSINKSIEEAELRHLHGVFLVEVERNDQSFSAPGPDFVLRAGDLLLFSGDVQDVGDLLNMNGLVLTHEEDFVFQNYSRILVEVIIAGTSSLVGRTIRDSEFRDKFDSAIISIFRAGHEIKGKIGDIELEAADALLLVCKPHFLKYQAHSPDFMIVQRIGQSPISYPRMQMVVAPLLQCTMIAIASSIPDIDTSLLACSLCTMFLCYWFKCLTWESVVDSVDMPIMVTIAASFPMSTALEKTGVAAVLSDNLLFLTSWMGEIGVYFGLYLTTMVLTALLSNASSAAIMVPIAFELAKTPEVVYNGVRPLLYTIMVAASADFSTPIGYQTNLMVWARGGYRFLDYTRFGLPLQFVLMFVSVVVIYFSGDVLGSRDLWTPTNTTNATRITFEGFNHLLNTF